MDRRQARRDNARRASATRADRSDRAPSAPRHRSARVRAARPCSRSAQIERARRSRARDRRAARDDAPPCRVRPRPARRWWGCRRQEVRESCCAPAPTCGRRRHRLRGASPTHRAPRAERRRTVAPGNTLPASRPCTATVRAGTPCSRAALDAACATRQCRFPRTGAAPRDNARKTTDRSAHRNTCRRRQGTGSSGTRN